MVRTAIGASRQRLLAQQVTETLLLAAIAGGAGLLLAVWNVDALVVLLPASASFATGPALLDWRVLCYTLGISLVAGLVFGGLPALRATPTATLLSRCAYPSDEIAPSSYQGERRGRRSKVEAVGSRSRFPYYQTRTAASRRIAGFITRKDRGGIRRTTHDD